MFTAVTLTLIVLSQGGDVPHSAVEVAALKARQEIRSGHLTLEHFHLSGSGIPVSTLYDFSFYDESRFLKRVDQGPRECYPPSVVPNTTRTIKTPEWRMSHRVDNGFQGRRFAATVTERAWVEAMEREHPELREHVDLENEMVFDPRLIGMVPFSIGRFYKKSLNSYLCGPRTGEATVQKSVLRGEQRTRVTVTRPSGARFDAWIDESRDFVPVRMERTTIEEDGTTLTEVMDADLNLVKEGPHSRWFPSHLRFELRSRAGQVTQIMEREEILVLNAEFNIHDQCVFRQFRLEALELPEDTLIVDHSRAAAATTDPAVLRSGEATLRKWHEGSAVPLTQEDIELRRGSR